MNVYKKADTLIECAIAGLNGCYSCKYNYKHKCLLNNNYNKMNIDYEKALIDLDEEFPIEM